MDDEPELLTMPTGILADVGFTHIVTASDMAGALLRLSEQKPDLAVLDVMLPVGTALS